MSSRGVIAAGHPLTVEAAETMLREGGNAFDAILAAHFAACVVEPVLASLGGGGFMIAQPQGKPPVVYDFFVQTPRHKRPTEDLDFRPIWANFGTAQQEFHIGQGTIATPGSVKGIFRIHRELATLPLAHISAPAVSYARAGVPLNSTQAYVLNIVSPIYEATPAARDIFCGGNAQPHVLAEGQLLRQPQLAATIERLVAEGEDLFYRGEIAQEIAQHCRNAGGQLTEADLANYHVVARRPLTIDCFGAQVLTNPPPSSGGIMIAFALELLKASLGTDLTFGDDAYLRLLAEAMSLTQRARIESLATQESSSNEDRCLLTSGLLDLYREEIRGRAQAIRGTTQFSVIDAEGNHASMTVSNGEGCGNMVSNTGIMLNNMLGEQDLNIGGFHLWNEDERMTSMMAPSLIKTSRGATLATGSGGSNRIRTALLQVILNVIYFRMNVKNAVTSPRIHLEADKLSVEAGFDPEVVRKLFASWPNHETWPEHNLFFGGAHTVMHRDGQFFGIGDPRRGGVCQIIDELR